MIQVRGGEDDARRPELRQVIEIECPRDPAHRLGALVLHQAGEAVRKGIVQRTAPGLTRPGPKASINQARRMSRLGGTEKVSLMAP